MTVLVSKDRRQRKGCGKGWRDGRKWSLLMRLIVDQTGKSEAFQERRKHRQWSSIHSESALRRQQSQTRSVSLQRVPIPVWETVLPSNWTKHECQLREKLRRGVRG